MSDMTMQIATSRPNEGRDKPPESWWTFVMLLKNLRSKLTKCHFHIPLVKVSHMSKSEVSRVEKYIPATGKQWQGNVGMEELW